MTTNTKRTYLNLSYVQGEEIEFEFDVVEDCEQLYLDEYDLTGSVVEMFNDTPVANFTFSESEVNASAWVATITSVVSASLIPQVYQYEIKMTHKVTGKPETLLYGTLEIKTTRIPI